MATTFRIGLCLLLIAAGAASPPMTHGQATSPIPAGTVPEQLLTGLGFGEGPLWHPDGFLLFSELDRNRIRQYNPQTGDAKVFLAPSGGSNGLAFDPQGRLIICRRDEGDIARLESDGTITVLTASYKGAPYNGPNDIVVRSDGAIYFTDPQRTDQTNPDAVYLLRPDGRVHRIDSTLNFANGVALSPDEQRLYVNAARSQTVYSYDVADDGNLSNKREFANVDDARYLDGMKVDESGRLYVAGGGGIWIYRPGGRLVHHLALSGNTTNLAWGDLNRRTLYITSTTSLRRITVDATGFVLTAAEDRAHPLSAQMSLRPSYPNPFTTRSTLSYELSKPGHVELTIHNQSGQLIRTILSESRPSGVHQAVWDGKDDFGRKVSSGVYFHTLRAASGIRSRPIVVVR